MKMEVELNRLVSQRKTFSLPKCTLSFVEETVYSINIVSEAEMPSHAEKAFLERQFRIEKE